MREPAELKRSRHRAEINDMMEEFHAYAKLHEFTTMVVLSDDNDVSDLEFRAFVYPVDRPRMFASVISNMVKLEPRTISYAVDHRDVFKREFQDEARRHGWWKRRLSELGEWALKKSK